MVLTLQRGNAYRDAPASRLTEEIAAFLLLYLTLECHGTRSNAGAWKRGKSLVCYCVEYRYPDTRPTGLRGKALLVNLYMC